MTQKMSGKSNILFFGFVLGALIYILRKNNNSFLVKDISLDQYKNRLSEFYINGELDDKMKEMCSYVSSGVTVNDAFDMLTVGLL